MATCTSTCRRRVLYSTDMLLDKNKDYVVAENAALVASSASTFVRGLLPSPDEDTPGTQRRNAFKLNSVGAQFRSQVSFDGKNLSFFHSSSKILLLEGQFGSNLS